MTLDERLLPDPVALKPKQLRAVEALADGCLYKDAAKRANVSVRRLWSWRQEASFQAALDRERYRRSERNRMLREHRSVLIAEAYAKLIPALVDDPEVPTDRKLKALAAVERGDVGCVSELDWAHLLAQAAQRNADAVSLLRPSPYDGDDEPFEREEYRKGRAELLRRAGADAEAMLMLSEPDDEPDAAFKCGMAIDPVGTAREEVEKHEREDRRQAKAAGFTSRAMNGKAMTPEVEAMLDVLLEAAEAANGNGNGNGDDEGGEEVCEFVRRALRNAEIATGSS